MVPHQDTVPIPHKAVTGVPRNEENATHKSKTGNYLPADGNQTNQFSSSESEHSKDNYLTVKPKLSLKGYIQLWRFVFLTVVQKCERHTIKVVKPMIERMVTVIIEGFTVYTLMPLS